MSSGSQLAVVETGTRIPRPADQTKLALCHILSGDRWAGAEVQAASLLKALAVRADVSPCVILLNDGRLADEIRQTGVPLTVIPEDRTGFVNTAYKAANFLKPRAIEVVHSHRYKENLLAVWVAWHCGIRYVVRTQHGLPEPFGGLKQVKHTLVQGLDRMVARWATDRVVCVTKDMQQQLTRVVDKSKLEVIYNGIDTTKVFSNLSVIEAKRRLGIPPESPVVGTAGRVEPIKRLDLFLAAAAEISRERPQAIFLIVGSGSENARLQAMARSMRIQTAVRFMGHRDDIYDVLRAMDVFVLCSDHEGLPMVLLEAMWLGIPIAARRVGGVPEVVEDGVHGWLLDNADPCELASVCLQVLANTDKSRMARAASRVATEFSAARNAAGMMRLYQSLTGVR